MSITTRAPYGAELEYMPINAFGGVSQFKLNPIAQAFAGQPDLHGGGGIGKILGVVAAIAIPFAAPIISSAIGLSTAIGATLGSAAVGAALGGISAAATGGDWRQGMLFGGIGGGLSGYSSAAAGTTAGTTTAPVGGVTPAAATTPVGAATPAGQYYGPSSVFAGGGGTPTGLAGTGTGAEYGSWMASQGGQQAAQQARGLASSVASTNPNAPVNVFNAPSGAPVGVNTATAPTAVAPTNTFAGVPNTNVMQGAKTTAAAATTPSAVTTGTASSFGEAMKQVPTAIANRFKSPEALADITLRAAGSLLGSAMAGDGLSAEERQLMAAQVEDLKKLREQDQTLFNQRLQQSLDIAGSAKYFDPEAYGLQSARRAQTDVARQQRAGLRGTSGGKRDYLERQYALEGGRRTGTAFDIGFGQGTQAKLAVQQAGLSTMPTTAPSGSTTTGFNSLSSMYASANERRRREAEGFGSLFGDFTGIAKSRALG